MIEQLLSGLINQATHVGLITKDDRLYVRNQVMHLLDITTFPEDVIPLEASIPELLDQIITYAIDHNVIEDIFDDKEMLAASVMNCFVARPSEVNRTFYQKYEQSPKEATDYFYRLSQNSNYIQLKRINKNIHFASSTPYGDMDITINLSKPEKDPAQIKREREQKQKTNYPKCVLCVENEGYVGRIGHPARANHRVIKVPLQGENWYLQYSPYVYYNEHSILLAEEHRNMKIDRQAFERLILFTERFPHYFIGSNADLPIVGGSILSHDHYQAGNYQFAMTTAENAFTFTLERFPSIHAAVLQWPLSVIRLQSQHKEQLLDAADHILQQWRGYSDEGAAIHAFSGNVPHNTITPIARLHKNGTHELDLVLRNNRTSEAHPMGIFHPHADVHHIKKENIGLIEVMGLAVLPARLKEELAEIKQHLLGESAAIATYHQAWAQQLQQQYGVINDEDRATSIIKEEVGKKFTKALEDAGVFKQKEDFSRFIDTLNR
ncbi:hypothetical protein M948_05685 [Virgibacillus sp. CM-4]|uniref:UDP-glucose--hexose-1-phosphate uridylyltransferase n=1 Tax=Virgibacillus sp. CM-4 TaxID=1354277 RepID=UPI0003883236|nr:UDP-glucose--hexose-1-phosphate uridylyltransferase [Virgibacillus sp. CM-4]EQB38062.1 hypothetical protein M948_05685 [Virgibacillus sp. CM-4]